MTLISCHYNLKNIIQIYADIVTPRLDIMDISDKFEHASTIQKHTNGQLWLSLWSSTSLENTTTCRTTCVYTVAAWGSISYFGVLYMSGKMNHPKWQVASQYDRSFLMRCEWSLRSAAVT